MLITSKPVAKVPETATEAKKKAFIDTLYSGFGLSHWTGGDGKLLIDCPSTTPENAEWSAIMAIHINQLLSGSIGDLAHARDWHSAVAAHIKAKHGIEALHALKERLLKPQESDRDKDLKSWKTFQQERGELPITTMTRLLQIRDRLVSHGDIRKSDMDIKDEFVNAMLEGPYKDKLSRLQTERSSGRLKLADDPPHDVAKLFESELESKGVIKDGKITQGQLGTARRGTASDGGSGEGDGGGGPGPLTAMTKDEFIKHCRMYPCIICWKTDHRAQHCELAKQAGYEIKWKSVHQRRRDGRGGGPNVDGETTPAPAPAPGPAPAPAPAPAGGSNQSSSNVPPYRLVGTTRRVLGVCRRMDSHVSSLDGLTALDGPTTNSFACADSGADVDMDPDRSHFETYTPLTNSVVRLGDGSTVPVEGRGTIAFRLGGRTVRYRDVLHVPALDVMLLSIRVHRRRRGCSFVADATEMALKFPNFSVSIDDSDDTLVPIGTVPRGALADYDETKHTARLRGQAAVLKKMLGAARPVQTRSRTAQQTHPTPAASESASAAAASAADPPPDSPDDTMSDDASIATDYSDAVFPPSWQESAPPHSRAYATDDLPTNIGVGTPPPTHEIPLPSYYVAESGRGQTITYTSMQLHRLLGGRKLENYSKLADLYDGLKVDTTVDPHPGQVEDATEGTFANQTRRKRNKRATRASRRLQKVCMDIGYGPAASPGGARYCLVLVDSYSRQVFTYGLNGLSGMDVQDALYRFFIDAGGVPDTIQCDYDPRFLGGIVRRMLHSKGIRIRSSPPYRQSQNGLVERTWAVICRMARCFLTEAQLPKSYWYWAVREAGIRLNFMPTNHPVNGRATTPFELFYERKPDGRVLFPFGVLGTYSRESPTFETESTPGIVVGRSDYTNGLIFYNPLSKTFGVSADYTLDPHKSLRTLFPRVVYDGGFDPVSLHSRSKGTADPYPVGTTVYAYLEGDGITVTGDVVAVPTKRQPYYRVQLPDDQCIRVSAEALWDEHDHPYMDAEYDPARIDEHPLPPTWLCDGCGVTVRTVDGYKRGTLEHRIDEESSDETWTLRVCPSDISGGPDSYELEALRRTWRRRMLDRDLIPGWPADPKTAEMSLWLKLSAAPAADIEDATPDGERNPERTHHARIVSAKGLRRRIAPSNLREALRMHNPDQPIWLGAYKEEYEALLKMNTFDIIDEAELQRYKAMGCEIVPCMTIFDIKPDEKGDPYRAKARTVVLGNLEQRTWSKDDKYAPVLGSIGNRILTSEAVSRGRKVKQGDCKNAFCQPELPDDEIIIVIPPKGCPFTKPGTYWKLNKTLYGLSRSPKHWYEKITGILKELGFVPCDHEPCLWRTDPTNGQSPVFVGLYVDDFGYFGETDEREAWFEQELKKRLTVDFMGPMTYFLGCRYDWIDHDDGTLSVHISQEGFADAVLDKFGMTNCRAASTPFRSGLPIDRIPEDEDLSDSERQTIQKELQSMLGCFTWLYTSTRPDLGVSTSLLAQYQSHPSRGHLEGARHALRYLNTTKDVGISFHQSAAHVPTPWPKAVVNEKTKSNTYTDSNWGPQDASRPLPPDEETRTVTEEECRSIQGYIIMRQHGPVAWGLTREARISGSSCEAEIKAVDEGTKGTQYVRYVEEELVIADPGIPTPLHNDNNGAVDWSQTGKVSKKLRHVNIREFRVRQARKAGEIDIGFIPGKQNPADLLTKEHKSPEDYRTARDVVVSRRPDGGY